MAAIALLGLYRYAPDGPFSGLAIAGFALISGPIFLLAAVDVGRALRRERLSPVVSAVARIPEFLLGSLAFVTGVGGIALVLWGDMAPAWRIYGAVVSSGMLLYGARLLHHIGIRWKSIKRQSNSGDGA